MHKHAFQAMKRMFMQVSGFSSPYFETKNKYIFFLNQNMVTKTGDMLKRAFQGLKRTFMHVSSLPPPYFD